MYTTLTHSRLSSPSAFQVACELDLWAEAFRSVEDIQQLILLAKKHPKQQMMATYYARLTQIFAKSENHTYHAYAWLKLFNFTVRGKMPGRDGEGVQHAPHPGHCRVGEPRLPRVRMAQAVQLNGLRGDARGKEGRALHAPMRLCPSM